MQRKADKSCYREEEQTRKGAERGTRHYGVEIMTLVCYTHSAKQSQKYTHTTCFLSVNPLSTPSLSPAHTQGHTRCAVVDNSYQQWPQSTPAEQYLLIYRPFLFNALSLHTHSHLNMNVLVSVGETFMWCLFCSSVTIWS